MEYPLFINGESCGRIETQQDGLYTVVEAIAPGQGGSIVKIRIWSGEKSIYLGTMLPKDGGLYLRRKLSRRELSGLAEGIEYASDEERPRNTAAPETTEQQADEMTAVEAAEEADLVPAVAVIAISDTSAPQEEIEEILEKDAAACVDDDSADEDILWFSTPEGTLRGFDGEHSIIALPAELHSAPPGAQMRRIDGRDYMVFRY